MMMHAPVSTVHVPTHLPCCTLSRFHRVYNRFKKAIIKVLVPCLLVMFLNLPPAFVSLASVLPDSLDVQDGKSMEEGAWLSI